jgi:quercetin dioxygenase-like cupin family protein
VKAGDVLEMPPLGMRIVFLQTAEDTGGELLEYEVHGRPRGFPAQGHVHPRQTERHEVVSGSLLVKMHKQSRVLGPGESVEIPAGTAHRHYAAGTGDGHVLVQLRPALHTEDLLERLAELSASGAITKQGYPKPGAMAGLILDFPDEGRGARPPESLQRAFAHTIKAFSADEYVFVDEWDVAAAPEPVFDLIADARTYPDWWRPVYIDTETDGPPAPGRTSKQHFKGRLPYTLRTSSTITVYDPPHQVGADVVGDLRGRGLWTLTPRGGTTHICFDWRVFADKKIVKALTPVARPAFRWNHAWAIACAMEGLEPAARRRAGLA